MVRGDGQFEAADFDISACYSERGQALPSSRPQAAAPEPLLSPATYLRSAHLQEVLSGRRWATKTNS
jgi:hypothetical protein